MINVIFALSIFAMLAIVATLLWRLAAALAGPKPRHAPSATPCENCGRTPTEYFKFHAMRGTIIWYTESWLDKHLCRTCALSLGGAMQAETKKRGWYSITSIVFTPIALGLNAKALRRAEAMDAPATYGSDPL